MIRQWLSFSGFWIHRKSNLHEPFIHTNKNNNNNNNNNNKNPSILSFDFRRKIQIPIH